MDMLSQILYDKTVDCGKKYKLRHIDIFNKIKSRKLAPSKQVIPLINIYWHILFVRLGSKNNTDISKRDDFARLD